MAVGSSEPSTSMARTMNGCFSSRTHTQTSSTNRFRIVWSAANRCWRVFSARASRSRDRRLHIRRPLSRDEWRAPRSARPILSPTLYRSGNLPRRSGPSRDRRIDLLPVPQPSFFRGQSRSIRGPANRVASATGSRLYSFDLDVQERSVSIFAASLQPSRSCSQRWHPISS